MHSLIGAKSWLVGVQVIRILCARWYQRLLKLNIWFRIVQRQGAPTINEPLQGEELRTYITAIATRELSARVSQPADLQSPLTYSFAEAATAVFRPVEQEVANDPLLNFFQQRGIEVIRIRERNEHSVDLDHLARFIGNRYAGVQVLMDGVKHALYTTQPFVLNLSNADERTISDCCQVGSGLQKLGLAQFCYTSGKKVIQLTPVRKGQAPPFLTGAWLEAFMEFQLENALRQRGCKQIVIARNVEIRLSDGKRHELDLFCLADGEPLLFEGTTSAYSKHVPRFVAVCKAMDMPPPRAILVASNTHNLTVTTHRPRSFRLTNIAFLTTTIHAALKTTSCVTTGHSDHYDSL